MCLPKPTELHSTGSDPDAKSRLQLMTVSLSRCDKHSAGAVLPTGEPGARDGLGLGRGTWELRTSCSIFL